MNYEEKEMIEDLLTMMIKDYEMLGLPTNRAWEVIDDSLVELIEDWYYPIDELESSVEELLKCAHSSFDDVLETFQKVV